MSNRRLLLVSLVAVVLYLPTLGYGFTGWDDTRYVTESPLIGANDGLGRIWTSDEAEQYYPLTFTSFWVEYRLWGSDPRGYHATNILLHGLNTLLVLLVLRSLSIGMWSSTVVGLLFAAHPVQVMTVAWIAQRKNLLSCACVLLALYAWTRFRRDERVTWYALAMLAFLAGLLSKTAILTLPLALLALDRALLGVSFRRSVTGLLPLAVPILLAALVTIRFEQAFVEGMPERILRPQIAAAALWFYAVDLVAPIGLSPIYPPWSVAIDSVIWWLPVIALVAAIVLVWRHRTRLGGAPIYGAVHFVVFLLPMLGLLDYGNLALTLVSDHYLYIPCIGAFIAIVTPAERWSHGIAARRQAISAVAAVALVAAIVASVAYMPVFRDGESLWRRSLDASPDAAVAHAGLGRVHETRGEWSDAARHYAEAARLMPGVAAARLDLATALLRAAEPRAAAEAFRDVLALDPASFDAHLNLGAISLGFLDRASAERHYRAAVDLRPGHSLAWLGWATSLRGQQRFAEAVDVLERGLEAVPDDVSLLNFLARILSTAPDDAIRDGATALRLAALANERADGGDYRVLETLAAAQAESEQWTPAAATARRAATLARSAGDTRFAAYAEDRAADYDRRVPLRETPGNPS